MFFLFDNDCIAQQCFADKKQNYVVANYDYFTVNLYMLLNLTAGLRLQRHIISYYLVETS